MRFQCAELFCLRADEADVCRMLLRNDQRKADVIEAEQRPGVVPILYFTLEGGEVPIDSGRDILHRNRNVVDRVEGGHASNLQDSELQNRREAFPGRCGVFELHASIFGDSHHPLIVMQGIMVKQK